MLIVLATLALDSANPAQQLYDRVQARLRAERAVQVDLNGERFRYMGSRYRLDAEQRAVVCDGNRIVFIEHDRLLRNEIAPKIWPDEVWVRGFESLAHGAFRPLCTGLSKALFAGHPALSVDAKYPNEAAHSCKLFFDPKTKLPLGYRRYQESGSTPEIAYLRVDLHPHLKASDFTVSKL